MKPLRAHAHARVNYTMGVPEADDVMPHHQSTPFHDALFPSRLHLRPAPEFAQCLEHSRPDLPPMTAPPEAGLA